jgi:hypothetical protein
MIFGTDSTGTQNEIRFFTGGFATTANERMRMTASLVQLFQDLQIDGNTQATGNMSINGSLKIGTSSTVGYVWKATDTLGNGSWQADATGGGGSSTPYEMLRQTMFLPF